jgi:hypothetical protein
VEASPAEWRPALRHWLEFRKALWRDYAIPPHQELHATKFVHGRDRISANPPTRFVHEGTTFWKDLGREVAIRCFETLRDCHHIRIGSAFRETPKRRGEYAGEKSALYADLVRMWDAEQKSFGDFAFIGMDGDGSDPSYFNAHRSLKLDTRNIIEDPMFHDSRRSQWTQMADLVAFAAHVHVNPHAGNEFGWNWYRDYLSSRDPQQAPIRVPTR